MLQHKCARLPIGEALAKAGLKPIDRERPAVLKARKALASAVASFLAARAPGIADQLVALLGLQKARKKPRAASEDESEDEDGESGGHGRAPGGGGFTPGAAAALAGGAIASLEFGDEWRALVSLAEGSLVGMTRDGAESALGQLGVKVEDVRVLAGDNAAAWGRDRAAELIGMKRDDDGNLVPNPNAKWRIDDSTREMLRGAVEKALTEGKSADELKADILESNAFSASRAETIARTEIAKADMAGTMTGYRASGLVAGKEWSTAQDDQVSEECEACERAGVIGLNDKFPSGEDAPPNHPNCRCTVLPVLNDELPEAGKTTKDVNMTKLYAAIEKAEKQDDGTLKVYGFASSEVVDSDGETVTADAMKAAREGYMAWGAVREMHDAKKAAGVAIEYDVQEDGRTFFGAHVVDPVAVLKCETGVYKGFSIGARVPKGGREGKVIKSIDLREVSLVDRPANPEAVFTLCKADGGEEPVEKGMYELSDFASVLRNIGYLVAQAGWEAQSEGDKSPLPAALMEWLKSGIGIFQAMAAEETAELLASLQAAMPAQTNVDVIAAADDAANLAKAGKRFSSATKAALKSAHDACKAADKALADLKYEDEEADEAAEEGAKADASADLEKAQQAQATEIDELAKACGLELAEQTPLGLVKAAVTELVALRKANAELMAQPAAPKGAVNGVVISKTADASGEDKETVPVVKADGAVDDVATLIKAAQSRPIRVS